MYEWLFEVALDVRQVKKVYYGANNTTDMPVQVSSDSICARVVVFLEFIAVSRPTSLYYLDKKINVRSDVV